MPKFQKVISILEALPKNKQRFGRYAYKNAQGNCCVLGAIVPELQDLGKSQTSIYWLSRSTNNLENRLLELDLSLNEAINLQRFNDKKYRNMAERYRKVLEWLKEQ